MCIIFGTTMPTGSTSLSLDAVHRLLRLNVPNMAAVNVTQVSNVCASVPCQELLSVWMVMNGSVRTTWKWEIGVSSLRAELSIIYLTEKRNIYKKRQKLDLFNADNILTNRQIAHHTQVKCSVKTCVTQHCNSKSSCVRSASSLQNTAPQHAHSVGQLCLTWQR